MNNKKLVNKILTNELVDVDVNTIDMDVLGESLLWLIPSIEDICKFIDRQILKIASIQYMPYVNAVEHYNYVVDSMMVKNDLVNLHYVFTYWRDRLSDKNRELYEAYFINRDKTVYKRKDRTIIPLIRAFMRYLHIMLDAKEKDLIKNPYVHAMYADLFIRIENKKRPGFHFIKKARFS